MRLLSDLLEKQATSVDIAMLNPDETKECPTASITKHAVKNSEIAEEFRRVLWFPAQLTMQ